MRCADPARGTHSATAADAHAAEEEEEQEEKASSEEEENSAPAEEEEDAKKTVGRDNQSTDGIEKDDWFVSKDTIADMAVAELNNTISRRGVLHKGKKS